MPGKRFKLDELVISGFKSIGPRVSIGFGDVNVIIGANGAGKSNLVAFFKMLNMMTTNALQEYIGRQGTANSILHYGSKTTTLLTAEISFSRGEDSDRYCFSLVHVPGDDTLMFADERLEWQRQEFPVPRQITPGGGHFESRLVGSARDGDETSKDLYHILGRCQVYHFHDTSPEAHIRNKVDRANDRYLYSDAGNLAVYLHVMKEREEHRKYYDRIVRRIQDAVPQFQDFDLAPSALNDAYMSLKWKERGQGDYVFGPHQISDGSLRFMALATLLLQPPEKLPGVIIIDEPELGLHPSAIGSLAGMVRTASRNCQVILATQSPRLVDEFAASEIIVAERDHENNCSSFRRLDEAALAQWLEEYSLSELWEKNVLGGQP